jgi:P27 family predicted phage terminase small subunit
LRGTFQRSRHATALAQAATSAVPIPRAPAHLSAEARRYWRDMVTRWAFDTRHLRLLTLALQAWDDAQVARAELRREGTSITMPSGARRPHPAVRREHDARASCARIFGQLGLEG